MTEKYDYKIKCSDSIGFRNNTTFCIGTGRMNLALRHEYHNQLKKVQEDIGFSYIRGHGLFCDDMAIYHTYEENGVLKEEYNFTYVDMVFDDYQALGIKPFVELGFMPEKLASGSQTVFYWKGNTTPPVDYDKWANLVTATINHWIDRYGRQELITWPFEVWNEPNLPGFWKDADMEEYFKLYDVTSRAVKSCDPRIRVGGPAICGVDDERWLRSFLEYCSKNKTPLDIVTRHAYATEAAKSDGHYAYQKLRTAEVFLSELKESRRIIDSFPKYAGMEMHITEFNTSYTPLNPIHDTNLNAAYVARLLSEMGDHCASYSYWTFGDVFEETGVAFTPFSGGFGLLTNGMIPKPTYWTFAFFQKIGSTAIARTEHFILTKDDNENIHGIAWNPVEDQGENNILLKFTLDLANGDYLFINSLVDEANCNPLKVWIDMGAPANPTKDEVQLLKDCSTPRISTKQFRVTNSQTDIDITLSANAVCYFKIKQIVPKSDRGYQVDLIRGAR